MANDPLLAPLMLTHEAILTPSTPAEQAPTPGAALPAPTEEQVQASDRAFATPGEQELVAGLLGMQVGVLVLRDLFVQTVEAPAGEKERPRKPKEEEGVR